MQDSIFTIWDFDWSFVDENTDTVVLKSLGIENDALKQWYDEGLGWTECMDRGLAEIHSSGKTREDIEKALREGVPVREAMIRALHLAAQAGKVFIISDANTFYIDYLLCQAGVRELFSSVETNPGAFTADGRLSVSPHHPRHLPPHSCPMCPANMCKGEILKRLLAEHTSTLEPQGHQHHHHDHQQQQQREGDDGDTAGAGGGAAPLGSSWRPTLVYVGDGLGDMCPATLLSQHDTLLARQGFPLAKKLAEDGEKVSAKVYLWETAEDVERYLEELLHDHEV